MVTDREIINISKSSLSPGWKRMRFNLTNCGGCHTRKILSVGARLRLGVVVEFHSPYIPPQQFHSRYPTRDIS